MKDNHIVKNSNGKTEQNVQETLDALLKEFPYLKEVWLSAGTTNFSLPNLPPDISSKLMRNVLSKFGKQKGSNTKSSPLSPKSPSFHLLQLSICAYIAIDLKKMIGSRQGQRSDTLTAVPYSSKKSAKKYFPISFSGRTDQWIANVVGVKRSTLSFVIKVVESKNQTLIAAMDSRQLLPRQAFLLLDFSLEELKVVLQKNKKELTAYFKELKNSQDKKPRLAHKVVAHVLRCLEKKILFAQKQHNRPLYVVYCGLLLICCDNYGRFQWDVALLKAKVLPGSSHVDFEKILDDLCECGALKKEQKGGEVVGIVPLDIKARKRTML